MLRGHFVRRRAVGAAVLALLAGGVGPVLPAGAAPAADGLGIAGRTTTTGVCVGGGELTTTTRPASRRGRVVVSVTGSGLRPGSVWDGGIVRPNGTVLPLGPLTARGGGWTVTRTVDRRRTAPVATSFDSGLRRFCGVVVKRRDPVGSASLCTRVGSSVTLRLADGAEAGTARVVGEVASDQPGRSRWDLELVVDADSGRDGTAVQREPLGRDGAVSAVLSTTLRGEGVVTMAASGRLDGEVVARCAVSLAGRFTR